MMMADRRCFAIKFQEQRSEEVDMEHCRCRQLVQVQTRHVFKIDFKCHNCVMLQGHKHHSLLTVFLASSKLGCNCIQASCRCAYKIGSVIQAALPLFFFNPYSCGHAIANACVCKVQQEQRRADRTTGETPKIRCIQGAANFPDAQQASFKELTASFPRTRPTC